MNPGHGKTKEKNTVKTLVTRIAITFALLLALGAFFGGVSSPTAHAATHTTAATASSNITIVNCTDQNFFVFHSLNGPDMCFAGAGYTPITIPDVFAACSGNNTADIYTQSGTYFAAAGAGCHGFPNGPVTVIGINIR
jgi:beta/gamma crystallin